MELLVPITFFLAVVMIIKIISDNRLRQRLIEKGMVDENVKNLYASSMDIQPLSSIKWGLVLIGIGLALLINRLWPYYFSDEAALGLMFLFAGLGFLIYYFIAQRQFKKTGGDK